MGTGAGTARGLGLGCGGSSDLAVTGSGSGLGLGRFADSEKGSSIKKSNKLGWAEPGWCFMIATCLRISSVRREKDRVLYQQSFLDACRSRFDTVPIPATDAIGTGDFKIKAFELIT